LQVLGYLGLIDIGVIVLIPRAIAYATGRATGSVNSPELPFVIGRTARVVFYQLPMIVGVAA
jgi:hypothetical protein